MISKNKKKVTKSIKNVDKMVTWLVLGWILASVYWVKKYEDLKHEKEALEEAKKEEEKKENNAWFLNKIFSWKEEKEERKDTLFETVLKIVIKNLIWKK